MRTSSFLTLACSLLIASAASAQMPTNESYFGIRAGYLSASTTVTSSRHDIRFAGVTPLSSFYAGAFYQRKLSAWLAFRTELTYQQKGMEHQLPKGELVNRQKFHYIGLTPLIGITPINDLGLFIGPEANLSLGQNIKNNNATPIEFGISGRLAYRYKWIGLEVGYFQSLNQFTYLDLGVRFGFTNQTWQAGLSFVPCRLKKDGK